MSDIIIHDAPDSVTEKLRSLAAAHGVSESEELLLLVKKALASESTAGPAQPSSLKSWPISDDDAPDWLFDRHDIRNGQQLFPKNEDFKAHLLALGDCGADIALERLHDEEAHRRVEF